MRSPLTYLSEHFVVDIKHNEEIDKWYKYSYTGFICNVWGEHTLRWAGSDKIIIVTRHSNVEKYKKW